MQLNKKQQLSLLRKYSNSPSGHASFLSFRRSVVPGWSGEAMVQWCGMWLGIELDGYTHS